MLDNLDCFIVYFMLIIVNFLISKDAFYNYDKIGIGLAYTRKEITLRKKS